MGIDNGEISEIFDLKDEKEYFIREILQNRKIEKCDEFEEIINDEESMKYLIKVIESIAKKSLDENIITRYCFLVAYAAEEDDKFKKELEILKKYDDNPDALYKAADLIKDYFEKENLEKIIEKIFKKIYNSFERENCIDILFAFYYSVKLTVYIIREKILMSIENKVKNEEKKGFEILKNSDIANGLVEKEVDEFSKEFLNKIVEIYENIKDEEK